MKKTRLLDAMAALALAAVGATPASGDEKAPPLSENVEHVTTVPGSTGGHVAIEGKRMYVGAYGMGMRIFDISKPEAPEVVGEWMPGFEGPGDPGLRADAVPDAARFGKRHIATLGGTSRTASTTRTEFLDVTDPANPELLWEMVGDQDGEAHNGDIVDKRKLWMPSGGDNLLGLRIYDMRPLLGKKPKAPRLLFAGDPALLWEASPYRKGRPVGNPYTHTHDVTVYPDFKVRMGGKTKKRDIALLAEGGSYLSNAGNTGSIVVVDITNPRRPVALNRWTNDEGHAIRYYHEAQFLDGDNSVMIVTDEDLHNGCNAGGVALVRVSPDLTSAKKLSEWFIGTGTPAPVCSAHVFSTKGDYMYMGSYNAGLQVLDLSNPEEPVKAGYYTEPGMNSWGAQWYKGVVYVGDFGARGLDVFKFTPAEG